MTTDPWSNGSSPGGIRSIQKATAMLSVFTPEHPDLRLSEIAEQLSLPTATAHRYATSLVNAGLMS